MARFSRGGKYLKKSHGERKGIGYSIRVSTIIANIKGIGLSYSHISWLNKPA